MAESRKSTGSSIVAPIKGELLEGRVELGNKIKWQDKNGEQRGKVCEIRRTGKQPVVAVVRTRWDMRQVELTNVAGKQVQKGKAKEPVKKTRKKTGNPFIDKAGDN